MKLNPFEWEPYVFFPIMIAAILLIGLLTGGINL
jgi:hypothetical protein